MAMFGSVEEEYQARLAAGVRKRGGDVGRKVMQYRDVFMVKSYQFRAFGLNHWGGGGLDYPKNVMS